MGIPPLLGKPVRDFGAIHVADLRVNDGIVAGELLKHITGLRRAAGDGQIAGDDDAVGLFQPLDFAKPGCLVVKIAHDDPCADPGGRGRRTGSSGSGDRKGRKRLGAWHVGNFLVLLGLQGIPACLSLQGIPLH